MQITVHHLLHPALRGGRKLRPARGVRRLKAVRPNHSNELWLRAELRGLVRRCQTEVNSHLLPALKPSFPGLLTDSKEQEDLVKRIKAKMGGALKPEIERLARAASLRALRSVDERLARSVYDSVSINLEPYLTRTPAVAEALGEKTVANVNLIESIPSQYFQQITDVVADEWTAGGRWENLVDAIGERGGVAEGRAKVIARDQTSKLNSAFNQIRQDSVGIEEYEWSGMEDETERPNHFDLNGTIHRWDEPGPCAGTIDGEPCHPGEDILCRCSALPYINLDALEAYVDQREAA